MTGLLASLSDAELMKAVSAASAETAKAVMEKTAESKPIETLFALVLVAILIAIIVLFGLLLRFMRAREDNEDARVAQYSQSFETIAEKFSAATTQGRNECHSFTLSLQQKQQENIDAHREIVRSQREVTRDLSHVADKLNDISQKHEGQ